LQIVYGCIESASLSQEDVPPHIWIIPTIVRSHKTFGQEPVGAAHVVIIQVIKCDWVVIAGSSNAL
jgi:hypothetical protein